jgi:hypothetical protein
VGADLRPDIILLKESAPSTCVRYNMDLHERDGGGGGSGCCNALSDCCDGVCPAKVGTCQGVPTNVGDRLMP